MLRWVGHLEVWAMLEVVMLGILVALVKIAQLASVDPGIGMYAFGATILLIPAIAGSLDRREMWRGSNGWILTYGQRRYLVRAAPAK